MVGEQGQIALKRHSILLKVPYLAEIFEPHLVKTLNSPPGKKSTKTALCEFMLHSKAHRDYVTLSNGYHVFLSIMQVKKDYLLGIKTYDPNCQSLINTRVIFRYDLEEIPRWDKGRNKILGIKAIDDDIVLAWSVKSANDDYLILVKRIPLSGEADDKILAIDSSYDGSFSMDAFFNSFIIGFLRYKHRFLVQSFSIKDHEFINKNVSTKYFSEVGHFALKTSPVDGSYVLFLLDDNYLDRWATIIFCPNFALILT